MRIIVLKEKHGDVYYNAGSTVEDAEIAARRILRERCEAGYWYEGADETKAWAALTAGKALVYLTSRKRHEYEDFTIEDVK